MNQLNTHYQQSIFHNNDTGMWDIVLINIKVVVGVNTFHLF